MIKLHRLFISLFCLTLLVGCNNGNTAASTTPEKEEVLDALRLANDYFMNKWSDPGQPIPYPTRNKEYESNLWTRAYYYEGLIDLWKIDPQQRYLDYALEWGNKHEWGLRNSAEGWMTRNADNQCAGQAYLFLYEQDPAKPTHYIENIKRSVDSMMVTNKIDDWNWIDAIQMAMPIFAQLGNITGDTAYYNRAYDMYMYSKLQHGENGLYNPEDQLWWRDADFDPPYTEPNGEDCYWSRGNGWVVVAMARMLDLLPQDEPHRIEYETMLVEMSEALKKVQREDGYWNVSLHDPDNYGGKELTGTSMFIYGMAYGVNNGLLDRAEYAPVIYKAWNALVSESLHPNGFLGYVQGTGKEPKEAQPVTYEREPDFDDYGLGAFLMAGAEIYKML
ncbi:glycoside hydrolase family 88 protein [Dysgonomonadaceae bacterium zrk40]|nr:glycoside hydrolase family 88 protein [Dysgonomonadaceae bacterium zrk40]